MGWKVLKSSKNSKEIQTKSKRPEYMVEYYESFNHTHCSG